MKIMKCDWRALDMSQNGELKVISLRHKRLEKKYKKLFDIYSKFIAIFHKQKPIEKKQKHQIQNPLSK